jgi:NAD(P)-dependent dehydrogenase (short-subunit alcohol dehydrogenase family)
LALLGLYVGLSSKSAEGRMVMPLTADRAIVRSAFDLTGRTVLVTGASSGVGAHLARVLSANGAHVVLAARREVLLTALRNEIEARGSRALAVEMDVADEASVKAGFDAAEAVFGRVDVVIANAGVNAPGSALALEVDDFDRIVAVNLRGVFLAAREGARRMIKLRSDETPDGRVVIISSVTAHHAPPGVAAYSATKAAVAQLGRVLAREWAGKGINVNVLCPGYMLTDLTEAHWGDPKGRALLEQFPRRRLMDLEALDPLALYLSSDASAQVTGSVFDVDDGQTL